MRRYLWKKNHSRPNQLSGIDLSFPRVCPSWGEVNYTLQSFLPLSFITRSAQLAWLNPIPIAVGSGRINRYRSHKRACSFNETQSSYDNVFTITTKSFYDHILMKSSSLFLHKRDEGKYIAVITLIYVKVITISLWKLDLITQGSARVRWGAAATARVHKAVDGGAGARTRAANHSIRLHKDYQILSASLCH